MDFIYYLVVGLLLIIAMNYVLLGEYFQYHCNSESVCQLTSNKVSYNLLDR